MREYCCHVRAGAPSCYLETLDQLQKQIFRTVGPSVTATLEPLSYCCNVVSLSLFYWDNFGRCLSELAELVPCSYSWGRATHYSDRLHDFFVTIHRCYKDVCVSSFFPCTARLLFSLAWSESQLKNGLWDNQYLMKTHFCSFLGWEESDWDGSSFFWSCNTPLVIHYLL